MYYRNRYDRTGECSTMGENAETLFKKLLVKLGDVDEARIDGQLTHIDFILKRNDKPALKYEVKSRKKVRRSDLGVTDDTIWVEFSNVMGDRGWLYGKADYMAFERELDFVIVERSALVKMAEEKCKLFPLVRFSEEALYRGYQRKGRNDLLSMVRMSDIIDVAEEIWPKDLK